MTRPRPSRKNLTNQQDDNPNWSSSTNPSGPSSAEDECNQPIPLTSRNMSYWLSLFFFVTPIYIVTPLSWVFVALRVGLLSLQRVHRAELGLPDPPPLWQRVLLFYCSFECIFSIYYQWLASVARRTKTVCPGKTVKHLQLSFNRVLQSGLSPCPLPHSPSLPHPDLESPLEYSDPRAADFRAHFRYWFHGAPWRSITRRSASEWLSWTMFDRKVDGLDETQAGIVDDATEMLERRAGSKLRLEPEDGEEHIVPVTVTWDGVVIWSRPGIVYIVNVLVNWAIRWYLERRYRMVLHEHEGYQYMIRAESAPSGAGRRPIVLMHGLGFGVIQYSSLVISLLRDLPRSHPVLIPLQPQISHSILHPFHMAPPPPQDVVRQLASLLRRLRWDEEGVTAISHSKGSVLHAWMLKAHPRIIKRSCFIDPVCFCLWEGDLCWNFIYRKPRTGTELLLKYFAATEPGIALAVQRNFDWAANSMWFEEIPRACDPYYTRYVLGGKDAVIDGWRVRRYLLNNGVTDGLSWHPNARHAQPIFDKRRLRELNEWVVMPEARLSSVSPNETETEERSDADA